MRYTPKHYASKQPASRIRIASISVASAATLAAGVGFAAAPANAAGGGVWDRVAACESGGNWSINTGNGFSGGLQFTPSTWRAFGGHGSPTTASKAEQIRVAQRTLAVQGPRAWPVCSIKAGLTRANGGAASSAPSTDVSRSTVRQAPVQKHQAPVQKHQAPVQKHQAPVQKHQAPVQKHYTAQKNTWVAPKRATQRAAAPQAAAPTAAPASNLQEITVKQGDTLAKLAAQYDLSNWQDIFAVNRATVQDPDLIFVGQSLNLPS